MALNSAKPTFLHSSVAGWGGEENLQFLAAIQNRYFGHGVEGSLKVPIVVVQGTKALVSVKRRYPNDGRLASRIEAGFTKGQARPLFVVKRR